MYISNEKKTGESGKMMALAAVSTNVLILTIMIASIWFMYSLVDKADRLNELTRGFQLLP